MKSSEYAAKLEAEQKAKNAQYTAKMEAARAQYEIDKKVEQEKIAAEKIAKQEMFAAWHKDQDAKNKTSHQAWRDAHPEPEVYDLDTLDNIGLNIQGRYEPTPELKPLTEDQKSLLDKLAESGASASALAEMEQELRSKND